MYKFILYVIDQNENILATLNSKSEIAKLLNDPEINNCVNEIKLSLYLADHHCRATINDMEYKMDGPNMDNPNMTLTITYKQLCPEVDESQSTNI